MARIICITSLVAFFSVAAVVHASADCNSEFETCRSPCNRLSKVDDINNSHYLSCLIPCSDAADRCRADEARRADAARRADEARREQQRSEMARRTLQDWNRQGLIPGGRCNGIVC